MKFPGIIKLTSGGALPLIAMATLVLTGCSSSNSNSGAAPAATPKAERTSAKTTVAASETPASKSMFTIDQNSRDPFFPKAKRAVAQTEQSAKQPEAAIDVAALLRDGFQGTMGNGETRIALINNIMLEPGRRTVIPIPAAGQSRSIPVRCREVLKDAVVLEVEGYPQPLRIARTTTN